MSNEMDPRLEEISTKPLPLSDREENPPLVVDLPDGQKLVVGDIKAGTVIEVATWRGTGRPDSRTHRFMLGISHDEPEALIRPTRSEPEVKEEVKGVVIPPVTVEAIPVPAVEVPEVSVVAVAEQAIPEPVVETPEVIAQEAEILTDEFKIELEPELEPQSVENKVTEEPQLSEAVDQSDFLKGERLSSRTDLLFGASTQYIEKSIAYYPPSNPGKQLVAPMKNAKKKKNGKALTQTGLTLGGIVAIVLTLWALNIGIVHPKSGLATAMGEAKSTLMIVKSKDSYLVGDSVVGNSASQNENPVFGVIAAAGDGVYMLNGDLGYISIAQNQVHGRVIAIAPWWGKLASLLGF